MGIISAARSFSLSQQLPKRHASQGRVVHSKAHMMNDPEAARYMLHYMREAIPYFETLLKWQRDDLSDYRCVDADAEWDAAVREQIYAVYRHLMKALAILIEVSIGEGSHRDNPQIQAFREAHARFDRLRRTHRVTIVGASRIYEQRKIDASEKLLARYPHNQDVAWFICDVVEYAAQRRLFS